MNKRKLNFLMGILIFVIGVYAFFQGGTRMVDKWETGFQESITTQAEKTFLPTHPNLSQRILRLKTT